MLMSIVSGLIMTSRWMLSETLLQAENASRRVAAIKTKFVFIKAKVHINRQIWEPSFGRCDTGKGAVDPGGFRSA
ncbi:hypothetical protein AQ505_10315 [Pedobacter sp. PACM 27299]|nr:hypothetical protein AQ505_10315 [Pedobacter sp. PACM 27299]